MKGKYFLDVPEGGFAYVIERRPRRKTIGIQVRTDGKVVIAAPPLVPVFYLKRLLRKKAAWVQRKLAVNIERGKQQAAKCYDNGSEVRFLGECYSLQIDGGDTSWLDNKSGVLHLATIDHAEQEKTAVMAVLETWYRAQALVMFEQRCRHFSERLSCEESRCEPASVGIKGYKTRWGSCHTDGRIYFNWRLVMASMAVIDYVVAHELAHLRHKNHSPLFWQQVEALFPDYREPRAWLRKNGHRLEL